MTPEIALTLAIILMAVILFATERLRVDLIALLVLLAVSFTGLVSKEDVFLGFANPAVITIWAVYIVSGGLFKTGVADKLGSVILRVSGASEARLIVVIMLTCGVMSAFMNNVGAVAILMPAVIGSVLIAAGRNDDLDRDTRQYPRPRNLDRPRLAELQFF